MIYSPGFQIPDGQLYPSGLVRSWKASLPDGATFPMAFKIRQSFDTGWRVALNEASAYGVRRIHAAFIPNWASGRPDWEWIRRALALLNKEAPDDADIFARLGNYRDGKNERCSFETHALHEQEFATLLPLRFHWAVGDDRGMVAAVKGWRERASIYTLDTPKMIEVQSYSESSGLTAEHPPLLRDALHRAGWLGSIAFVECHRWFKPHEAQWKDYARLATAQTGEALRKVAASCTAHGIGFMLFTGDTAFDGLDPTHRLNPAGLALLDRPRVPATAYRPNSLRSWWTTQRLSLA